MAIAVGEHTKTSAAGGGVALTTVTLNVANGDSILICGNTSDTDLNTPTDNVTTNTYTPVGPLQTLAGGQRNRCWLATNVNGNAAMVFALTSNGTGVVSIYVVEITGMAASPLDTFDVAADASSPYVSPGITPSQANILLLGFHSSEGPGGTVNHTAGNSFSLLDEESDGNQFYNGYTSSRNVSSIAAYNTSTTVSSSIDRSSNWIIALKDPIPGGGNTPNVSESVSVVESVSMKMNLGKVNITTESVAVTESLTMHMPIGVRMYKP